MSSFDVVSSTDLPKVDNALRGAIRAISSRYAFKDSTYSIERSDEILKIWADDELKLMRVKGLLRGYLAVQLLPEN